MITTLDTTYCGYYNVRAVLKNMEVLTCSFKFVWRVLGLRSVMELLESVCWCIWGRTKIKTASFYLMQGIVTSIAHSSRESTQNVNPAIMKLQAWLWTLTPVLETVIYLLYVTTTYLMSFTCMEFPSGWIIGISVQAPNNKIRPSC